MTCKVCKRPIVLSERFTVCTYRHKDGTETKWIRCERCQQKSVVNANVKPMQRMKFQVKQ